MLPLCFGEGTKLAQFLLDADKEYEATFQLGAETETDDAAGAVTRLASAAHVTETTVKAALLSFLGEQAQTPPMYSALKRDGRPLTNTPARGDRRAGAPPHPHPGLRPPRLRRDDGSGSAGAPSPGPALDVRVRCTKGTYIRTLARDLGHALGTVAHVTALRRTRSGPFDLGQAIALDELGRAPVRLVSPADALCHLPVVRLDDAAALRLTQGRPMAWGELSADGAGDSADGAGDGPAPADGLTRFLTDGGELVAVARRGRPEEWIHTLRVFGAETRAAAAGGARKGGEMTHPETPA